jgi:predicted regulator of Ras-like GTPase activity (Roadblock/LC7/MglB family)
MSKLDQVLKEFHNEIGTDYISSSVMGPDGLSLADETIVPDREKVDDISGRSVMIVQLAKKISAKLNIGELEDDLITTDKYYAILRHLGDGSYSWNLVVSRNATLGTVRMYVEEYAPKVWDAIPH